VLITTATFSFAILLSSDFSLCWFLCFGVSSVVVWCISAAGVVFVSVEQVVGKYVCLKMVV
jgi:hypothetical protein